MCTIIVVGAIFGFFPTHVDARVDTWTSADTSAFPEVTGYDFTLDVSCGAITDTQLESENHHLFLGTTPLDVDQVLLYFPGNGSFSYEQYCSGGATDKVNAEILGACHAISERPNTAVIVFNRPGSVPNSESWFSGANNTDGQCIIEEARRVLDQAGVDSSAARISYAGWSEGVTTIKNLIPHLPASNVALFDGCYANSCEQIVQSSNAANVSLYYQSDTSEITNINAKSAINVNPTKVTAIALNETHRKIPGICALDFLLPGDPCYGLGTADGGQSARSAGSNTSNISGISLGVPNPQIKIPGLSFSNLSAEDLVTENSSGDKVLQIPFLGEYIVSVYQYAVGISVILAGIGILVGGIMYMTSGVSNTQAQAVSIIQKSIVGMILAISSYLILFTINSDLINFRNLQVVYVKKELIGPDPYLGTTLVDTTLFGTLDYETLVPGEWNQTITSCPITMPPRDPSLSRDAYNYQVYLALKNVISRQSAAYPSQANRVIAAAEVAAACQPMFGSCGTTAGTIYAIAGSGNKRNSCISSADNECNGNRGREVWRASGINRAIRYGHRCESDPKTASSHVSNGYNLIDPQIDGTYPRSDCTTDASEARQRVLLFFQQQMFRGDLNGSTQYPADVLNQLRPGDYVTYYNGNKSTTGSHAVIFLGWADEPGKAQVISGSASRPPRPHTACLGAECGQNMIPIVGIWRPT